MRITLNVMLIWFKALTLIVALLGDSLTETRNDQLFNQRSRRAPLHQAKAFDFENDEIGNP